MPRPSLPRKGCVCGSLRKKGYDWERWHIGLLWIAISSDLLCPWKMECLAVSYMDDCQTADLKFETELWLATSVFASCTVSK